MAEMTLDGPEDTEFESAGGTTALRDVLHELNAPTLDDGSLRLLHLGLAATRDEVGNPDDVLLVLMNRGTQDSLEPLSTFAASTGEVYERELACLALDHLLRRFGNIESPEVDAANATLLRIVQESPGMTPTAVFAVRALGRGESGQSLLLDEATRTNNDEIRACIRQSFLADAPKGSTLNISVPPSETCMQASDATMDRARRLFDKKRRP